VVLRFALWFSWGQSQRIQKAADVKELAPETPGTSGLELQCVHAALLLVNFKNFCSQNETDHIQLTIKVQRREAVMENCKHSSENYSRAKGVPYLY
jgi:hypothetical protein